MARAVQASKNGAGSQYGTYATESLLPFQQPTMPAGSNVITLSNPWPEYPDFVRQGGTAITPAISVVGGTVSSIVIGSGSSVGTSGTFPVQGLQPVIISYSVAPTVSWSLAPMFWADPLNAKSQVSV